MRTLPTTYLRSDVLLTSSPRRQSVRSTCVLLPENVEDCLLVDEQRRREQWEESPEKIDDDGGGDAGEDISLFETSPKPEYADWGRSGCEVGGVSGWDGVWWDGKG